MLQNSGLQASNTVGTHTETFAAGRIPHHSPAAWIVAVSSTDGLSCGTGDFCNAVCMLDRSHCNSFRQAILNAMIQHQAQSRHESLHPGSLQPARVQNCSASGSFLWKVFLVLAQHLQIARSCWAKLGVHVQCPIPRRIRASSLK